MPVLRNAERDAAIVAAVQKGRTYASVGNDHDLSGERVRQICAKAGRASRTYVRLTFPEKKVIERQFHQGIPFACMDVEHDRTVIANYARRAGLYTPKPVDPLWTDEEDRKLTRMWGHEPTRFIAENLNRTRNEIIGRAHRLKLRKLDSVKFLRKVKELERAA